MMKLIHGEIEPNIGIGELKIGEGKEQILKLCSSSFKLWERGDGFSTYTFENFKLWFDVDGKLQQIGVTKGFLDGYNNVHIGDTLSDVKKIYDKYDEDGDVYLIPGVDGICFELEDVDDWNELTAPIEWIYVYKAF